MTTLEELRARQALRDARVPPSGPLEAASSVTNRVWVGEDHVVRVCSRGGRLRREARLARALPPEVLYPPAVADGTTGGTDWFVLERVAGRPLGRSWPDLDLNQRRMAVHQLADVLRVVHQVTTPSDIGWLERPPQPLGTTGAGRAVEPTLTALDIACRLPHVDALMLREASDFVDRNARVLEPWRTDTLIHGDLTFENILWDGERITALLDFEFSRGAPADLDLDILLRCCAHPKLHVAEDYEDRTHAADYEPVPVWLKEDYPELFDRPDLRTRLAIYAIAFDVRELVDIPPAGSSRPLSDVHPLNRIRRTLEGTSYLERV